MEEKDNGWMRQVSTYPEVSKEGLQALICRLLVSLTREMFDDGGGRSINSTPVFGKLREERHRHFCLNTKNGFRTGYETESNNAQQAGRFAW